MALASGGATIVSGCGGGANALPWVPTNPNQGNANRIAFSSNRDGNFEIYTMNPDGTDVQRITTATGDDTKPAWSRDKTKLAFVSERDGNPEIYIQNIAGGKPVGAAKRITDNPAFDGAPSWNPDGTQLVFESQRGGPNTLYILDTETRVVNRLTQRTGFLEQNPAWSPKGDLIAFQSADFSVGSNPNGFPSFIYTVKINGADAKKITDNPGAANGGVDVDPAWNPSATQIAFFRSNPNLLSVAVVDGAITNLIPSSSSGLGYTDPSYGPDGKRVICSKYSNASANLSLYILNADGTGANIIRVTDDSSEDKDPSW